MGVILKNNATSTITTAISASDVGLAVAAGTGSLFPTLGASDYFYATLVSSGGTYEVIKVTARVGDTMTIVRAQEGTTAQSFVSGSRIEVRVTAASITDMVDEHDQASEISFAPTGAISSTNVQDAIAEVSGDVTAFAASNGSALVGFSHSETYPAGTIGAKAKNIVSVKDAPYNAKGDNTTNDTTAIQAALNSGAKEVILPAGSTFIVDGGLLVSTNGQRITAYGATIKLKANATTKHIIRSTATDVVFAGGTYDGNKANGNSSGSTYDSWGVFMYADRCTVQDAHFINCYGMGIKGFGNYLSALNNRISGSEHYGIFFDGSVSVSHTGNRAIGNMIDMSEGQVTGGENIGQGILFTAGSGQAQTAWELSDNNIIGPQTSVQDQAINLAVRGNSGIVSNNTTRYGSMGFSEGGANTVIDGNRLLNLVGSTRYGIEPSGGNVVISGNIVTDAIRGIIVSGNINYDNMVITGNRISSSDLGIYFQIASTYTAHNCIISGNNITFGNYGVSTLRDVKGLNINNNILIGPSATFASGRGIFLDTPPTDAYVYVTGNTIVNVARPYAVYSGSSATFNYLFATNNNISLAGSNANSSFWNVEGAAVIGGTVISANNINPASLGLQYDVLDQNTRLLRLYGSGSPEGGVTAGIGSMYLNTSGGAGTTLYVKASGTGNTGWTALS